METTITLECLADSWEQFRDLEHKLRQIHGLKVFFVEPRDADAPVLISIAIPHKAEQADLQIRRIAHTLYAFVHDAETQPGTYKITIVTIEGESVDLVPLSNDQIGDVIDSAYSNQG